MRSDGFLVALMGVCVFMLGAAAGAKVGETYPTEGPTISKCVNEDGSASVLPCQWDTSHVIVTDGTTLYLKHGEVKPEVSYKLVCDPGYRLIGRNNGYPSLNCEPKGGVR